MRVFDLIMKKREGQALSDEEIAFLIKGYTDGTIPDYQMSALAMAIVWRGMDARETAALTREMADSGDRVDLSEFGDLSVDKHSTGGVGDKTSLIVAPIVCACGAKLAKMSGRGLGHTGGTVDKLESIRGYRSELSNEAFFAQVRKVGIAIIGQTGNITPADKKLYALRDVTATVDSVPLIVSSIMSKKLAAGAKTIVLDVKVGSGAFMHDLASAETLAEAMVSIGKKCGRKTAAVLTNMDMPLGYAIGNSLEVIEAIDLLKNGTKGDLREICLTLSATMLELCFEKSYEQAFSMAQDALDSGRAFAVFREWIAAQGGDVTWIDCVDNFPKAPYRVPVYSTGEGYITAMDTQRIGLVSSILGAGRTKKEDAIDHSAGILLAAKTGDRVEPGQLLATLCTSNDAVLSQAEKEYRAALTLGKVPAEPIPLIYERIV